VKIPVDGMPSFDGALLRYDLAGYNLEGERYGGKYDQKRVNRGGVTISLRTQKTCDYNVVDEIDCGGQSGAR
jgi:hypothetical protein